MGSSLHLCSPIPANKWTFLSFIYRSRRLKTTLLVFFVCFGQRIFCNFHYGRVYITCCFLFCLLDLFNYICSYILYVVDIIGNENICNLWQFSFNFALTDWVFIKALSRCCRGKRDERATIPILNLEESLKTYFKVIEKKFPT